MATIVELGAPRRAPLDACPWSWLGLVPFFLFAFLFIVAPVAYLVIGSFQDNEGQTTLQNYADLTTPSIVERLPDEHRGQPRDGDRRRDLRFPARLCGDPRRSARASSAAP